ncbi:MAG: hypothetical protein ACI8TX_003279 [Hyphomicrobiaceae bacterium]|jgi:hypothetical protein
MRSRSVFGRVFLGALFCAGFGQSSNALAEEPCFYGKQAFTIEYKLSGTESGTVIEHVSECGRKRVEIQESTISMMGFTQATKKRTVYDGAEIVTIDGTTGAVTKAKNPLYDQLVANMDGQTVSSSARA